MDLGLQWRQLRQIRLNLSPWDLLNQEGSVLNGLPTLAELQHGGIVCTDKRLAGEKLHRPQVDPLIGESMLAIGRRLNDGRFSLRARRRQPFGEDLDMRILTQPEVSGIGQLPL